MVVAIERLTISYPDFVLNTTLDPEQFDTNNAEIVAKVNEIVDLFTNGLQSENIADGAVIDSKIGERSISYTAPTDDVVNLSEFINGVAYKLNQVIGIGSWRSNPNLSLQDAYYHVNSTSNPHNVTANQINTYTKEEIDAYMRGGDTRIKYEVFTIVTSDNGDGTFTYSDSDGNQYTGVLTADGYQRFNLQLGDYVIGENRIEAMINDTLHRSAVGGGLREIDTTVVEVLAEGNGAEITIKYYETIGLTGEHAITHTEGGSDEITITSGMMPNSVMSDISTAQTTADSAKSTAEGHASRHSAGGADAVIVTESMCDGSVQSKLNYAQSKITNKLSVGTTSPSSPSTNDVWIDTSS